MELTAACAVIIIHIVIHIHVTSLIPSIQFFTVTNTTIPSTSSPFTSFSFSFYSYSSYTTIVITMTNPSLAVKRYIHQRVVTLYMPY